MSDTQRITQQINPPDFVDAMDRLKQVIFSQLNCVQIGKIESVNASEQTVEIALQVKRRRGPDRIVSYPVLVDCPYFVLQGGGAYIDMPISQGDYCIVLFNDRNIDTWWDTANVAEPRTRRKHSLSDGIALVGINPRTQVLDADGSLVRVLGKSGSGAEELAARQNDETQSTSTEDATFWAWVAAVTSVLNSQHSAGLTAPSSLTGKITGGSDEVAIG